MVPASNRMLDSLSPHTRSILLSHTQPITLPLRSSLYRPETPPTYAYFLTGGIASLVTSSPEGRGVEVEIIGREGAVGLVHLLGPGLIPTDSFIQLPGEALRIRLHELQRLFADSAELRGRILEFIQQQNSTLGVIAGCHRLHSAEHRLARWLLMVSDRIGDNNLALTQEFLGEMLGSQRTTVSAVAAMLQNTGVIQYTRGHIHILDRPALEASACSCYAVTRELLANLYQPPGTADRPQAVPPLKLA